MQWTWGKPLAGCTVPVRGGASQMQAICVTEKSLSLIDSQGVGRSLGTPAAHNSQRTSSCVCVAGSRVTPEAPGPLITRMFWNWVIRPLRDLICCLEHDCVLHLPHRLHWSCSNYLSFILLFLVLCSHSFAFFCRRRFSFPLMYHFCVCLLISKVAVWYSWRTCQDHHCTFHQILSQ